MTNMTGSIWRKWDLHFHTQTSYDYQDKAVTDQEIIDILVANNVSVVAITDHHVIDTVRIRNLQKLGAGKITVLPGIEFRAELGGSESIHFIGIFSEKSDIEDIWIKLQSGCGITAADIAQKGGDKNIHCDLRETCQLIHRLGGIVTVHAGDKTNNIENITNSLPYKMALKTDLVINHIDILELGKEEDQNDYNEKVFPAINYRLPMILCSDNHNIKKYSVKQNLWIKADPTFEGLKQILFEPIHRVFIGADAPIDPLVRINKVELDFPIDVKFENEPFCFAGKTEIYFSPNFTCIIGGRGTGKSTMLNLIHEKLKPTENKFFQSKKIKDASGKIIPISTSVKIDNDTDEKYIEFLSQNEVEEFAQDYQKLTSAVYQRILKRDEAGLITRNEHLLKEQLDAFRTHILNKRRLESLKNELEQKIKEQETNKKLVASFTSDEYKRINDEIKIITSELSLLLKGAEQYAELIKTLEEINSKFNQSNPSNQYSVEVDRLTKAIQTLITESKGIDFSKSISDKEQLQIKLQNKRVELKKYLSEKGLTEESQQDISNANVIISQLESEIESKRLEISQIQKKIESFKKEDAVAISSIYKDEIETQIKSISSILEQLENASVKPISLQFEFDTQAAVERIFNDFKKLFEGALNRSNHKGDNILWEILFSLSPDQITDKETLVSTIQKYPSSSSAKQFLIELFSVDKNFEAYKLLCEMTFLNYADFKRVKVQYDGRPIENSSFGQRCTAVLVILLLLGNNPIIIDEPEAHLDSLLISNYLVDVIKDRKYSRQIIFATHNANFVINGDAELIHILNVDELTQNTSINSTTIENELTRDILVGLEGGRDAFKKRENKYQFYLQ
ncbi:MAG: PHP domain-containing protein [Bacteroidia bacterium]|nr:PHP domain-containing protein [Bacteroidia bacterium]